MDIYKDWLMHHGVKGQHWGIKNGPPYPIGSGSSDASSKKKIKSNKTKSLEENGFKRTAHDDFPQAKYKSISYDKNLKGKDLFDRECTYECTAAYSTQKKDETKPYFENQRVTPSKLCEEFAGKYFGDDTNNIKKLDSEIRKKISDILMKEDNDIWDDSVSYKNDKDKKQDILKRIGTWPKYENSSAHISIYDGATKPDANGLSFSMWYDDGDLFWGHALEVECTYYSDGRIKIGDDVSVQG